MAVTELTEPEQALWQAFARGAWVDLRDGGQDRVIRAEVITALLLGADSEPGHAPAVRWRRPGCARGNCSPTFWSRPAGYWSARWPRGAARVLTRR